MIGKRIQELRIIHGYSLSELANRSGVSKSYLSSLERDNSKNPSIHFLEKIATVFEMEVESLLRPGKIVEETQRYMDKEWLELISELIKMRISKRKLRLMTDFIKKIEGESLSSEAKRDNLMITTSGHYQLAIDQEWIEFIMAAENMGITVTDIRHFLEKSTTDGLGYATNGE